jgi:hypothetical protein
VSDDQISAGENKKSDGPPDRDVKDGYVLVLHGPRPRRKLTTASCRPGGLRGVRSARTQRSKSAVHHETRDGAGSAGCGNIGGGSQATEHALPQLWHSKARTSGSAHVRGNTRRSIIGSAHTSHRGRPGLIGYSVVRQGQPMLASKANAPTTTSANASSASDIVRSLKSHEINGIWRAMFRQVS